MLTFIRGCSRNRHPPTGPFTCYATAYRNAPGWVYRADFVLGLIAQLTGTKVSPNIVFRADIAALSEFNPLAVKPFLVRLAAQHGRPRPLAPALSLGAYKHHTRNPTGRKHPCPPTRKPRTRLAGSIRTFLLSPLKE